MKSVIEPVYQPVFDTRTNTVAYLEALARIRGNIQGAGHIHLLQLSEQFGFVQQIDLAMLDQVLEVLPETRTPVAINLSVQTIERASPQLFDRLDRHTHLLSRLLIEVTETVRITNLHDIQLFLRFVRAYGCRVAVDDYGDGHFTLPLVTELCPDFVKLSPVLLNRLYDSGDDTDLLAVLDVARHCNADLVAEHVDSLTKMVALQRLPIRYVQGYSFGLPGPHPERRPVAAIGG